MNIVVESLTRVPIEKQKVEIVERKGIGHPDSIADGIAEEVSRNLCKEYLKRYGILLHHNTDQVEVVGGESKVEFSGGEIIKPIFVLISGRATTHVGDEEIPVHEIAIKTARDFVKNILPHLPEDGIEFDSRIGMGSSDLRDVFMRKTNMPLSNDTSFGVGFAPLSETEKLVLEIENMLNSRWYKQKVPELGSDVKIMGLRKNNDIVITIAGAFISKFVPDIEHYKSTKERIIEDVKKTIEKHEISRKVDVYFNTADNYEKQLVYLTISGTSAENGDDGSVGRGNRVNGLITPNREMSLEAAAGKNPFNHVGKLYNIIANRIANEIFETLRTEVYVKILSQIGKAINEPLVVHVETEKKVEEKDVRPIIENEFENIPRLKEMIINNNIKVF